MRISRMGWCEPLTSSFPTTLTANAWAALAVVTEGEPETTTNPTRPARIVTIDQRTRRMATYIDCVNSQVNCRNRGVSPPKPPLVGLNPSVRDHSDDDTANCA